MFIAIGDVRLAPLIEQMKLVARDLTQDHELNEEGRGAWPHDDGWGVAYLDGNKWVIHKSEKPIFNDQGIEKFKEIESNVVIFHVRKKMGSEKHIENTHPFQQDEFVFCHNGFVQDEIKYSSKYQTKGQSDSEQLFYSLLTDLEGSLCTKKINKNLNRYTNFTGINCILASKTHAIIATPPGRFPKYYQMWKLQTPNTIIISSEKLNGENWQPITETITELQIPLPVKSL